MHPRQTKQSKRKSKLTAPQLEALIPAGPVSKNRAARDKIEIENVAEGNSGDAIVTRQRVLDPVMRLHRDGHIGIEEVQAASLFRRDHDNAFGASSNVLTSLCVDGGRGREHALDRQLHHATRYRKALAYLGPDLGRIAQWGIMEGFSYNAIGATALPGAGRRVQIDFGRELLIKALQRLALFHGGANTGHVKGRGYGIAAQKTAH
jgi:hypothetical protein